MKKDFIPIIVSLILIIASAIIALTTDYVLLPKHYYGLILLSISIITYFTNKKIYIYVFGVMLILGVAGLIDLFIYSLTIGIFGVGVSPIFLAILLIFVIVNKTIFFPVRVQDEKALANQKQDSQGLIDIFKVKYQDKSDTELNEIADEKSPFTQEARLAARDILREKNVL